MFRSCLFFLCDCPCFTGEFCSEDSVRISIDRVAVARAGIREPFLGCTSFAPVVAPAVLGCLGSSAFGWLLSPWEA